MENQNKKNNAGTIALVVLLLIVTIAALVLATYAWAKYSSNNGNNTASANVAKWNVTLDSENKNFVGEYSHVVTGNIAPGTKGSFDITINPNDTEVCIAYQIFLNNVVVQKKDGSTLTGIEHLKFFTSETYTAANEIAINGTVNNQMTGYIDLKGEGHNTAGFNGVTDNAVTKTIYWIWPYDRTEAQGYAAFADVLGADADAYDAADTAVGQEIEKITINYTIKAWQVDPANSDGANNTTTTNLPK